MRFTERRPFPHRRGLIIVTTLATAYVASHFFRASNVTIGLDLMRDLAIGPEPLARFYGAFFFGFAAMQSPAASSSTISARAVPWSACSSSPPSAASSSPWRRHGRCSHRPHADGRGFGAMLIGAMVVVSRWFPPDRFSTLIAIVLSIGLLGDLAATTPLAWPRRPSVAHRVRRRRRLHRARHHRRLVRRARRSAWAPLLAAPRSHRASC